MPVAESRYRYQTRSFSARRYTKRYRALALILALALTRPALSHTLRARPISRDGQDLAEQHVEVEYSCTGRAPESAMASEVGRDVSTAREEKSALGQKKNGQDEYFVDPSRISTGL